MPLLILIGFIALETWGILRAIELIGGAWTLAWLFTAAVVGFWLIAHGGLTALARIRIAVSRGEMPTLELFQALLTAFAGLLLIVPGFISDVLALSLLISGAGIRARLAQRLSGELSKARPDLRQPVTLDGEYRRK